MTFVWKIIFQEFNIFCQELSCGSYTETKRCLQIEQSFFVEPHVILYWGLAGAWHMIHYFGLVLLGPLSCGQDIVAEIVHKVGYICSSLQLRSHKSDCASQDHGLHIGVPQRWPLQRNYMKIF